MSKEGSEILTQKWFRKVKSPRKRLLPKDILTALNWLSIVPLIQNDRSENPSLSWNLSDCLSANLVVWKWNKNNLVHVVLLHIDVTNGNSIKTIEKSYGMSLLKTKLSDMVNVQNIIDIHLSYRKHRPLMALVFDILPLVASLSPYVTCFRASMETLGIFSPRFNDFTSDKFRIK